MAASHPAYVVGSAFVQQYYTILQRSPDLVHRFYQEGSTLSRPNSDGGMISVNTLDEINEKIMSEDYNEFKAEVKTVDAQDSFGSGVLVLVTGYITMEGGVKKNFAQSFFLAPQKKGFYVLNDVLRFVGEDANQQDDQSLTSNSSSVPLQETYLQEHNYHEAAELPSEEAHLGEEGEGHVDSGEGSVVDEERPMDEVANEVPKRSEEMLDNFSPKEAPKKSYATIVKFMKENPAPVLVPAHVKLERREVSAKVASAPDIRPNDPHGTEDSSMREEADSYSIYVKGLPFDVTSAELEEEFKRFGSIKPNGIQIRSNKAQGYCFGFVEFVEASAVQSAIEASPLTIGGLKVQIEEKRPSGARVSSRAKPSSARGIYRGDEARGRGYDGRGYSRGDFNNRGNYGSRGVGGGGSSVR